MKKTIHRGVTKAQWLEAGLKALSEGGAGALKIERLARSLGIAKAGFYWHFKNRDDMMQQLLDYWTHELTEVISKNPEISSLGPKDRLKRIAEMIIDYDLARYEIAIHQWALQDATAAKALKKVKNNRLDFIRDAFSELGFRDDELMMRTMLFACYHTWESITFKEISRKRRRELISKRIELLTTK